MQKDQVGVEVAMRTKCGTRVAVISNATDPLRGNDALLNSL